jgi:hypothetical protein
MAGPSGLILKMRRVQAQFEEKREAVMAIEAPLMTPVRSANQLNPSLAAPCRSLM